MEDTNHTEKLYPTLFKFTHCEHGFTTNEALLVHMKSKHPTFSHQVPTDTALLAASTTPVYFPGTTFSCFSDSCPRNVPPPTPCKNCSKFMIWRCSRIKQAKSWLHQYFCYPCINNSNNCICYKSHYKVSK